MTPTTTSAFTAMMALAGTPNDSIETMVAWSTRAPIALPASEKATS